MASRVTGTNEKPRRSNLTLWLILAACAAPVIASYAAYYFWPPTAHVNYGELIEPRALPDAELGAVGSGEAFRLAELKGQWVLLMAADACDAGCARNLVYMRQVRLAQGRDSGRIERVWLFTAAGMPDAALIAEHPGLRVARDSQGTVTAALPGRGAIHVVDPLGNLMMRFPADPDPRRMLKDISRLLRHSKWK